MQSKARLEVVSSQLNFPNTLQLILDLFSVVNVTMLPSAGMFGIVKHPMKGAIKSVQNLMFKGTEGVQWRTRVSDGVLAVKNSTEMERMSILKKFEEAKPGIKERQERLAKEAEEAIRKDLVEGQAPSSSSSATPQQLPRASSNDSLSRVSTGQQTHTEYDDEAFERDLALAKQLSLADH